MATQKWRGDAPAVAQVSTVTVTADDATTTYKVTINGKVVSVLGSGSGVNQTATNLQVALAASTIPEFLEVTWTVNAATITGTAATAGTPFTATSSVSGGTGTIGAFTTTTTSSGPADWSVAANWSTGSVPVAADDVYIENFSGKIQFGLGQSGVTLNSLNIAASFTGEIGLAVVNETGNYYEYRATYLAIGATTTRIGEGAGQGSARIKLDNGSVATTLNLSYTASPKEQGPKSVIWKGTNAGNVVNIIKGSFCAAQFAGEVATIATLTVGYVSNIQGDSDVFLGPGCTLTTIQKSGGTLLMQAGCTTLTSTGGDTTVERAAAITTINLYSGNLYWKSTGTIGTLTVDVAAADFTRDMRSRTVTNCTLNGGATLRDSYKTVTFTNPIAVGLNLAAITLDLGTNFNLQRS